MNEKKSNGFTALLLTLVVAVAVVFGVRMAGGTASQAAPAPGPGDGQGGAEAAGKYGVGTYTASGKGINGDDVTVTITIGEGDVITDVQVEGPGETPAIGGPAMEKLQAAILEAQSADVDTVASATVTSEAVITAAKDCLAQAEAAAGSGSGAAGASGAYKPGVYTHAEHGMNGDVTVTITIGDDGSIADVQIVGDQETPTIGGPAMEKLQAAILEAQSAEVDAIASATMTSNAAIKSAQACLDEAAN